MASILGTGLRIWRTRASFDLFPHLSRRFTHSAATQAERKKCIITPEFRRQLIEESRKKPPKEHFIDGINDPGDPCYGIALDNMFETLEKLKPKKGSN